jgi:cell division septum initiation protein DivIVA
MKGFAGGLKDQLAAKIEALDTQVADLLRENAELRERVQELEDALGVARLQLLNWDSKHSHIANRYRILISIIEQALAAKEPK